MTRETLDDARGLTARHGRSHEAQIDDVGFAGIEIRARNVGDLGTTPF